MTIEIKRKEGESIGSLLYRFNKKVQQSGVIREAKKRRFRSRGANRSKRKRSALYRLRKTAEVREILRQGKSL